MSADDRAPTGSAEVSPAVVQALVERVEDLEDRLDSARQTRVDLVARIHDLEEQLEE